MTLLGRILQAIPFLQILAYRCDRCGRPDFKHGMEQMPVRFEGRDCVATERFCQDCMVTMTKKERLERLKEAEFE